MDVAGGATLLTGRIRGDLAAAGFTVDDEVIAPTGAGQVAATLRATGPEHTATVTVTETPEDRRGDLTVVYLLVPVAG